MILNTFTANPLNENREYNDTEISMISVSHGQESNRKEPLTNTNDDMAQNPEITNPNSLLISCHGNMNKVRFTYQRSEADLKFQFGSFL